MHIDRKGQNSLALQLGFVIILATLLLTLNSMPQDDTWRHLALGRLFFEHGGLPKTEPFGFLNAGRPFIDLSWLSCVSFYAIYQLFSDTGLIVFSSFMAGLIFYLSLTFGSPLPSKKSGLSIGFSASAWAALLILTSLLTSAFKFRITARPELFGLCGFAFALHLLKDAKTKSFISFFLLIVVWNNFHSTAVMGVQLAIGYAALRYFLGIEEWKNSLVFVIVGCVALFVNPWGIHLVRTELFEPFHPHNQNIREFRPFTLVQWLPVRLPLLLFSAVSIFRQCWRGKVFICNAIIFALLTLLSLKFSRAFTYPLLFAAGASWTTLTDLMQWLDSKTHSPLMIQAAITISTIVTCFSININDSYGLNYRKTDNMLATEYLENLGFKGRILNDFAQGGYLIWRQPKNFSIFIDNRPPAYHETSIPVYANLQNSSYCQSIVSKLRIDAILMPTPQLCNTSGIEALLCNDFTGCINRSDFAVIFWTKAVFLAIQRNNHSADFIRDHEYHWINPLEMDIRKIALEMEQTLKLSDGYQNMGAELNRAMAENPENSKAILLRDILDALVGKKVLPSMHTDLFYEDVGASGY